MSSAEEDRADVERALAGDTAAFERIVRRWQGPLVNMAYRFCRDRGRAEDMAQDAFLRAYRALGQWRRDAAFSTWLFALAANLYRSELRRIPMREQPWEHLAEPVAESTTHGDMETRDRDNAIRRAVRQLPARYRDTLILFYFHERDIASVAGSLGVPAGTVKARLSRGRDLLKSKLQTIGILSTREERG